MSDFDFVQFPQKCEAACQERTGFGHFYRCTRPAKDTNVTMWGQTIGVCGIHARVRSGSVIKYTRR